MTVVLLVLLVFMPMHVLLYIINTNTCLEFWRQVFACVLVKIIVSVGPVR